MRARTRLLGIVPLLFALVAAGDANAAVIVPPHRIDTQGDVPYPKGAQGESIVVLILSISTEGTVTDVLVKRGAPPFSDAAIAAATSWLFTPATKDDVPVAARIKVEVTFHPPSPPPRTSGPSPSGATPPTPPNLAPSASLQDARTSTTTPTSTSTPTDQQQVVSVRAEREEPGTNHIPRTDTRFMPGAFADPFRAVEALPGVAPWLSGVPYFYVRGAPPESVGYALDGIKVPLLFHVGSGPSTISPSLVDSVDLFPGPYPARYGRFTGAMITGETTRPNMEESHANVSARAFDANAFAEVPFDDGRGSAMAAGRYGYTGALTKLVAPDYGVGYWDYQTRVSHKTWGEDTATLFAFGAHDELAYRGNKFFQVEFHRIDLRYDHPLKEGNLRAGVTFNYDDAYTAEQNPDNTVGSNGARLRGPGGRARVEVDQRLSSELRVRAGGDLGITHFNVDQTPLVTRGKHTDLEAGAYGDVVWRPHKRIELVPGVRMDVYGTKTMTRFVPQPRVAGRVRITQNVSWVSAFGTAHQEPTEEVFVPSKLPDPIELVSRDGYHLSEGVEVRLPERVRVHATAFYSRVFAPAVSSEERSYGGELFLRRDLSERLGGFVSYTLSRADTFAGRTEFRSAWDRTHLFSTALSYDIGRGFRAGARFFFESGRPYDTQCPNATCAPGDQGPLVHPVTGTLPAFYRLDARFEKRWTFSGSRFITASLECFNATNNSEPIGASYSPAGGLGIDTQSPVILPSIGIEAGF